MNTIWNFLILSGILFCLITPASAVPTDNIKLYAEQIEIDAGSYLVIPCHYNMNSHFQTKRNGGMEWGMVPEQGGDYKPVFMIYDNNKEPLQQPNIRARAFLSTHKGNCSLVIAPTQIEDSGTYQVHLLVNGERFTPTKKIKVHVKTCIESFGVDYCTCDEVQVKTATTGLDDKTIIIIAGSVAGGLLLLSFIGCFIGILICYRKKEKNMLKTIEEGEE